MITLYAFDRIFEAGIGETKDLRVQWALEETGLPYRVHPMDHGAGDLDSEAYGRINPFRQIPAIDDDGFVLTESAAIALYLAEKSGKLIPADVQGRARVTQWCCSAVATLEPTLVTLDYIDIFDEAKAAGAVRGAAVQMAHRWLGGVERRLEGRDWIACDDFTAADLMLAGVLRTIRKTDLMEPHPRVDAFYARCCARPAWERTLAMSAERLRVPIDRIR